MEKRKTHDFLGNLETTARCKVSFNLIANIFIIRRRETIQELGPDRMRLKAIKENTILPQAIRDEASEKLFTMPKYSHPRLVLNMCMFTGRQRGKIKPYRVNRHIFRFYT